MSFYVYVLRCSDGSYYVGHTDDLERRIAEHREEALECERQIKGWSQAKKEALIRGNWARIERLSRTYESP